MFWDGSSVVDVASLHAHSISMLMILLPMIGTGLGWYWTANFLSHSGCAQVKIYSKQYSREEKDVFKKTISGNLQCPLSPLILQSTFYFLILIGLQPHPNIPPTNTCPEAKSPYCQTDSQCFYFIW